MDLGTVKQKLKSYGSDHQAFATDVRLVWTNCQAYNEDSAEVTQWAQTLSDLFDGLYTDAFGSTGEAPPTKAKKSSGGKKSKDEPSLMTKKEIQKRCVNMITKITTMSSRGPSWSL